jgi:hypothetical protein
MAPACNWSDVMIKQDIANLYPVEWANLRLTASNANLPVDGYARSYKAVSDTIVNVAIPTLGLRDSLMDSIDSLLTSTYENIRIIVLVSENDKIIPLLKSLYGENKKIEIRFQKKHIGWMQGINVVAKQKGHLLTFSDDTFVMRDSIEILVAEMDRLFPDSDGMLPMNHTSTAWKTRTPDWTGLWPLIGNKFIDRFPGRQVICPDYCHNGGDTELFDFAISINKCIKINDAHILQIGRHAGKTDSTSKRSRNICIDDHILYCKRRQAGYLWGKNFNLLNGGA